MRYATLASGSWIMGTAHSEAEATNDFIALLK